MERVKVLIVDDSVVYRSQIRAALDDLPWIEVVGVASNGRLALERLMQTHPDLLILDLEMPEMDGLQTLTEMGHRGIRTKVLVFSSASKRGAAVTMEALRMGASDFVAKPGSDDAEKGSDPKSRIKELMEHRIRALFQPLATPKLSAVSSPRKVQLELLRPEIVVIGSSTGGPATLEKIFSQLKGPFRCPILIAQHMPPLFTAALAERLSRICGVPAWEGRHDMKVEKNCIYVAPGGFHMRVVGSAAEPQLSLDQGPKVHSVRPAVDPLFESASAIFKSRCLAFVLTGMGVDGRAGSDAVKRHNGAVVIQSEATCTVFGMPGAVKEAGVYDREVGPDQIAEIFREKVEGH